MIARTLDNIPARTGNVAGTGDVVLLELVAEGPLTRLKTTNVTEAVLNVMGVMIGRGEEVLLKRAKVVRDGVLEDAWIVSAAADVS